MHHAKNIGCIIQIYADCYDDEKTCVFIYDDELPYNLLSKIYLKFGSNLSSFAIDRRDLKDKNEDYSIIACLGNLNMNSKLVKFSFERKTLTGHILQQSVITP